MCARNTKQCRVDIWSSRYEFAGKTVYAMHASLIFFVCLCVYLLLNKQGTDIAAVLRELTEGTRLKVCTRKCCVDIALRQDSRAIIMAVDVSCRVIRVEYLFHN